MTLPTPEKLAELRKLAEATRAQPGDWFGADALCEYVTQFRRHEAAFIAAAGPTTVLSLLDALEAQRVELADWNLIKGEPVVVGRLAIIKLVAGRKAKSSRGE